jgi:hypothetical protein
LHAHESSVDEPQPIDSAPQADRARIEAGRNGPFDVVVDLPAGSAIGPWEEAGATWILADFGLQPREREVRETIEAGPR